MKTLTKYYKETVSIFIFLAALPLYLNVNFMQNDDWAYYQNIQNFLNWNFNLIPKTAPTFYSMGALATLWSVIFGIKLIPILTLVITIANFYLFILILESKFKFSKFTNICISSLLLTNFFHSYSSIGFMTENYLIFFLLLAILYFEKFETKRKIIYLHFSNIFGILTFLVKQPGIIFMTATALYFLLKKEYSKFKIQAIYLISLVLFYLFLFPKTSEMTKKNFLIDNFLEPNYIYSLVYGILIYLAFFTLPLIFSSLSSVISFRNFNLKKISIFIALFIVSYILTNKFFRPQFLAWAEFPYFQNIFERTGFLPRTLSGTKYQFKFNFLFFQYIDVLAKFAVSLSISLFALRYKKLLSVYSISIFGFIFLMLFVSPFFDRYILYAVPLSIILLCDYISDNLSTRLLIFAFVLFQAYFSYFMTSDFIKTHNYVWNKSKEIANGDANKAFDMLSSGAWTNTFGRNRVNPAYIFTYDSPQKNPELLQNYNLISSKRIEFFGNLFINSEIYLYKIK